MKLLLNKSLFWVSLVSAVAFLASINIYYLDLVISIPQTFFVYLRVTMIVVLGTLIVLYDRNPKRLNMFFYLILWFAVIFFSSVINDRNIRYMITNLSRCLLICVVYLYYMRDEKKQQVLLKTWKVLLIVLVVLDFVTMLKYPNGLYQTDLYTSNWFLGYKTARIVYTLPLMMITTYLDYIRYGRIKAYSFIILILCVINAYLSQATAGAVSLAVYVLLIIFLEMAQKNSKYKKVLYALLQVRNMLIIYSAIFVIVVLVDNNTVVSYIVENVFGKSGDLTNRTGIWLYCINAYLSKPIIGMGYLTTNEYISLTHLAGGASPHNMVLSILVTAGLIGAISYILLFYKSLKKKSREYEAAELSIVFAIIVTLLLGITSSAMVYAVFAYLPFIMIGARNGEGINFNYRYIRK